MARNGGKIQSMVFDSREGKPTQYYKWETNLNGTDDVSSDDKIADTRTDVHAACRPWPLVAATRMHIL